MHRLFLLLLLSMVFFPVQGQEHKGSVAILSFNLDYYSVANEKATAEYQAVVSGVFVSDKRFSVVERGKIYLIERERELQKSEDFINGQVVQQGVSIGADFLVTGYANSQKQVLTLSLYEVASGKLLGKEDLDLTLAYKLRVLVRQQFIQKYFPLPGIKLVKVLEGGPKAESVLIAAGTKAGIIRKETLEVKELTYEETDGQLLEREVTIGQIKVVQVENENFSICKVEEGQKAIAEKVAGGVRLFCKRANQ